MSGFIRAKSQAEIFREPRAGIFPVKAVGTGLLVCALLWSANIAELIIQKCAKQRRRDFLVHLALWMPKHLLGKKSY